MHRPDTTRLALAALLCTLTAALSLAAQTTTNNSPDAASVSRTEGQVVLPGSSTVTDLQDGTPAVRPDRPERLTLPTEVRQRLIEFEKVREAYLAQQKDLLRKLRGASDADRQKIREQLREQRESWLDQARQFRDQAQRRLDELKLELPRHQDLLDPARERAREAAKEARDRRGSN